jgi:biotin carboxyl carrier protein
VKYHAFVDGVEHVVTLDERQGNLEVTIDGRAVDVSWEEVDRLGQAALIVDGSSWGVSIERGGGETAVTVAGELHRVSVEDERERAAHAAERERSKGGGTIKSVMSGVVVEVLVAEGDAVEEGQPLLILEAMKMQNEIAAPAAGTVKRIHVSEAQVVGGGEKLVDLAG